MRWTRTTIHGQKLSSRSALILWKVDIRHGISVSLSALFSIPAFDLGYKLVPAMNPRSIIVIVFSLLYSSTAQAYSPYTTTQPLTAGTDPTIQPRAAPATHPALQILNISTLTPSTNDITCFTTGTHTNVTSCRPTLNHFRTFPFYRLIQPFREGFSPKLPNKPPLIIYHRESTCAVEIQATSPLIEDEFSYEQVRGVATDIVEECQEEGGFGGYGPVGAGVGWMVKVIGFDGTEVGGEDGDG